MKETRFYYDIDSNIWQKAQSIRLLIMDVDGVLTDGRIFIRHNTEEIKAFHTLDGHGIKMLHQADFCTAIITGRDAQAVAIRAKQLDIKYYFAGVHDKRVALQELLDQCSLTPEQCAYIGDDVVDLPIMTRVGLSVCVPQAHPFVQTKADYITRANAGAGAVREVCDLLLYAQGFYQKFMSEYCK